MGLRWRGKNIFLIKSDIGRFHAESADEYGGISFRVRVGMHDVDFRQETQRNAAKKLYYSIRNSTEFVRPEATLGGVVLDL